MNLLSKYVLFSCNLLFILSLYNILQHSIKDVKKKGLTSLDIAGAERAR